MLTLQITLNCFSSSKVVEPECERSTATTYFWYREALNIASSIDESGDLNWKMTLSLLAAWTLVGLAVIKGIKSSGKVQTNVQHANKLNLTLILFCRPSGNQQASTFTFRDSSNCHVF